MNWLGRLPTTQLRIAVTLLLTIGTAARYLLYGVPARVGANGVVDVATIGNGWGYWLLFLAAMAGLDVAQFAAKRFSDFGYASAKVTAEQRAAPAGAPTVNVNAAGAPSPAVVIGPAAAVPAPVAPFAAPARVELLGDAAPAAALARDAEHSER